MGFSISNYKRNVKAIKFATKKNAPLLLTIGGIGGLGLTAFASYKAAKQVVEITEDIEAIRANGGEVDRRHQLVRVGKAILPPVLIGSLSVAAIFGSYHVLNKRNGILATALSVVTAENKRLTGVLKSNNLLELAAPGVVNDTEYTDEEGQPVTVVERVDIPQLDDDDCYFRGSMYDFKQETGMSDEEVIDMLFKIEDEDEDQGRHVPDQLHVGA